MRITTILPVAPRDLSYLARSVRSVLRAAEFARAYFLQRSFRLLIVVDGPGFDPEILRPLADTASETEVQVWEIPQSGAATARNTMLAGCDTNEIVTFMDADDRMLTGSFALRLWEFDAPVMHPFVYTQVLWHKEGDTIYQTRHAVPQSIIKDVLENQNAIMTTTVMTHAIALQGAGGFEPNMICGEDGCLWRRTMKNVDPIALQEPTVTYTYRSNSQSKALHKATPDAFHLDPSKHGPMGQRLDDGIEERRQMFLRGGAYAFGAVEAKKVMVL